MDTRLQQRLIQEATEIIGGTTDPYCRLVDVLFSYRLFLQRYPEFEDEEGYLARASAGDLANLSLRFVQSQEFQRLWGIGDARRTPLPDIVVMAEVGPYRIHFKMRDVMIGHQVARGKYEPSMQALIRSNVELGMNCIDLGANIGFLSLLMASSVGETGTVHSFEPFPEAFAILAKNLDANSMQGIVRAYPVAAHARAGIAEMCYRADDANENYGSSFVANLPEEPQPWKKKVGNIQLARVDDIIPDELPIHFVKIDVEGSEVFALAGMERILRRWHPFVVVELNEYCLRRMGGVQPEDLLVALTSHGYKIYALDSYLAGDRIPYELDPNRKVPAFENLVCV
jgi:FkbM family methyltransferase